MKKRFTTGLPVLLIFALLASCGPVPPDAGKVRDVEKPPQKTAAPTPATAPEAPSETQKVKAARSRISALLTIQDYSGALQTISQEIQAGFPEEFFSDDYLTALDGTISYAETLRRNGEFEAAGNLYRQALESFPRDPALASRASRAPEQIMAAIDLCAAELMEDGLIAYRAGNLTQAIDIWKQLLLFHPEYEPARKATETAERQLENLRSLDEKKGVEDQK